MYQHDERRSPQIQTFIKWNDIVDMPCSYFVHSCFKAESDVNVMEQLTSAHN